jgi:hypothetical protein
MNLVAFTEVLTSHPEVSFSIQPKAHCVLVLSWNIPISVSRLLTHKQSRNKGGESGALAPGAVHVGGAKLKISK